jgi:defect in organelle trafficking protein DotA
LSGLKASLNRIALMKINKLFAFLLFVGFNCAFADTISFDTIFVANASDVSISFLSSLFGTVGTVITGGSNPIVSQMFMVFNTGIIAFVSALVFYTLTMSVINTAQDGNAMGQKVSTWIVLRIVAGISVLIPQYSGYSLIQVMVMWSVVQGVGFADSIWSTALDTMKDYGGAVAIPSQSQGQTYLDIATIATGGTDKNTSPIGSLSVPGTSATAASVFAAAVCAKAMYNKATADYMPSANTAAPSTANYGYFQKSSYSASASTPETWCFGYSSDGNASNCDAKCGEFEISTGVGSFYAQALGDLILVTAPAAVSSYDSYVSACEADSTSCPLGANNGDSTFTDGCGSLSDSTPEYSQNSVCVAANILNSGASTYYSTSLADRIEQTNALSTDWIDDAKSAGWAMAGSYYVNLSGGGNTNNAYSYDALVSPTIAKVVPSYIADSNWTKYSSSAWYKVYKNMLNTTPTVGSSSPCSSSGGTACSALSQYMISSNAWAQYMINQAINLNTTDMNCSTSSSGSTCSGTAGSSSTALTYDKFTAYMLQSLISGYKSNGSSGSSDSNPFGNLGSGKSLMFPETPEGNFTTFPLYLWSLLTQNLATLAGIDLYNNDNTSNLYGSNMSSIPSINSNCLKVAGVCAASAASSDGNYKGCLDAAIQYNCINTNNIGILGGVQAANNQELVDPLYSMAVVGRTFIKYSTAYWGAAIDAVYSKTTSLAGAYTGVSIATAVATSALAQLLVTFNFGYDVTGGMAIFTGALLSTYQLLFQIDKLVMEAYLPLGSAVALIFFILGVTLGIYLPFIPFLLFLFGLINWLISVIEAMVAAPLVAMGVTHPEGHDLLGKSEQAIMLLLGVFIRPAAMVIGFILSITLVYLMMQFLNYGFIYTANPLLADAAVNSATSFNMISIVGILLVYAYVAIEVINQCFGMIFQVPDKILRWIGGAPEQSNVSQMMQGVKGGVQSGAQGGGSAASGQASRGSQVSAGSSNFQKPEAKGGGSTSSSSGGKD